MSDINFPYTVTAFGLPLDSTLTLSFLSTPVFPIVHPLSSLYRFRAETPAKKSLDARIFSPFGRDVATTIVSSNTKAHPNALGAIRV